MLGYETWLVRQRWLVTRVLVAVKMARLREQGLEMGWRREILKISDKMGSLRVNCPKLSLLESRVLYFS